MNFGANQIAATRVRPSAFTLVEMMIAIAISVVVVGAIVMLSIISAQNFVATSNYVQMNDQSRIALDLISREIRNASELLAFNTNNPVYLQLTNSIKGTGATITYDASASTLTLSRTGQADKTVLTGCEFFGFQIFNRYPLITATNISFYPSTDSNGNLTNTLCKVINLNWKCSRAILGSKLNTEIVQTAQVVLRNQVSQ